MIRTPVAILLRLPSVSPIMDVVTAPRKQPTGIDGQILAYTYLLFLPHSCYNGRSKQNLLLYIETIVPINIWLGLSNVSLNASPFTICTRYLALLNPFPMTYHYIISKYKYEAK